VNAARRACALARVDDHHVIEARPRLHERRCFTVALAYYEPRILGASVSVPQPPCDESARRVIAPVGIPDTDHETSRHSLRRSSFRKCVAQEMQGS
jgi:hypothetical protein